MAKRSGGMQAEPVGELGKGENKSISNFKDGQTQPSPCFQRKVGILSSLG